MVMTPSRVDTTSPASIAAADFNTHRRGFDRDEVRAVLERIAAEVQRLQDENARLADEVAALRSGGASLDEATVADLLGEEAARVLSTARQAATQMRVKAEEGVERLLREAQDEATHRREEATLDAVRIRQEAASDVEAEIEAAKQEGRQMVTEARAVRERMLSDLARRRDSGRAQLARLRADRDRLVAAFEAAGRSVDDVLAELRAAAPEPADASDVETVDDAVAAVTAEPRTAHTAHAAHDQADTPAAQAAHAAHDQAHSSPMAPVGAENAPTGDTNASAPAERPVPMAADEAESGASTDTGEPAVAIHLGEEPSLTYAGELEPDADSTQRDSVDDLFAKLRAAGPADVAAAAHSAPMAPVGAESAPTGDTNEGEASPGARPDTESDHTPDADDAAYLAARAAVLDPIQSSIARHLKRALTDEQNEVLDALRRSDAPDDLDALVGAEATHAERYRAALAADLRAAGLAGAASVGEARDVPSSEVLEQSLAVVTADFVVPLRERLARALDDAAGDSVEAGATLRAGYREWRAQRADEVAAHLVLVAHGGGAYDAVVPGTPIHWVVDPDGPLCPDADDNGLAGVVAAGQEFPTGHCHAPAHPGCRCGIAVAQG
jgi:DivIVA domain-containing protein